MDYTISVSLVKKPEKILKQILGNARDNIKTLQNAVEYLKRFV